YQGRDISAGEVAHYLAGGYDSSRVKAGFEAGSWLRLDQGTAAAGLFSPDELSQIAAEAAGIGSTNGKYLGSLFSYANQVAPLYSQYGQGLDRSQLEQYFQAGRSPTDIGNILAGNSYAAANKDILNYEASAFGNGVLSQ